MNRGQCCERPQVYWIVPGSHRARSNDSSAHSWPDCTPGWPQIRAQARRSAPALVSRYQRQYGIQWGRVRKYALIAIGGPGVMTDPPTGGTVSFRASQYSPAADRDRVPRPMSGGRTHQSQRSVLQLRSRTRSGMRVAHCFAAEKARHGGKISKFGIGLWIST